VQSIAPPVSILNLDYKILVAGILCKRLHPNHVLSMFSPGFVEFGNLWRANPIGNHLNMLHKALVKAIIANIKPEHCPVVLCAAIAERDFAASAREKAVFPAPFAAEVAESTDDFLLFLQHSLEFTHGKIAQTRLINVSRAGCRWGMPADCQMQSIATLRRGNICNACALQSIWRDFARRAKGRGSASRTTPEAVREITHKTAPPLSLG
jgi:hypothetical protein